MALGHLIEIQRPFATAHLEPVHVLFVQTVDRFLGQGFAHQ